MSGGIYWVTGKPDSGKMHRAQLIYRGLQGDASDKSVFVLQEVAVRDTFEDQDYSEEGIERVTDLLVKMANLISAAGFRVIVVAVTPTKKLRHGLDKRLKSTLRAMVIHKGEGVMPEGLEWEDE